MKPIALAALLVVFLIHAPVAVFGADPAPAARVGQPSGSGITHSFFAAGGETVIVGEDDRVAWRYPASTRDGWVMEDGRVLMAVSKSKGYPSGAIVEVDREA